MSRQRKRGARGTKGRLASPAQMARLCAVLGRELTNPVSFEYWRDQMRSLRNTDRNLETELATWEHAYSRDKAAIAQVQAFSQALHEERLARDAREAL